MSRRALVLDRYMLRCQNYNWGARLTVRGAFWGITSRLRGRGAGRDYVTWDLIIIRARSAPSVRIFANCRAHLCHRLSLIGTSGMGGMGGCVCVSAAHLTERGVSGTRAIADEDATPGPAVGIESLQMSSECQNMGLMGLNAPCGLV